MILSINPWYFCNFRCNFCYLTEGQLSDKQLLPIDVLHERLLEIIPHSSIDMVDIYGGEVGLLPKSYMDQVKQLLHLYGIHDINVITNGSMINDVILDPDYYISVSFDFEAREKSDVVFKNMLLLPVPFSVLMLASPKFLEIDTDYMVNTLNLLPNLRSIEIKPYSTNQANVYSIPYTAFEEKVKSFISHPGKKFEFVNEFLLQSVIDGTRSSFSDDHVYITPSGKYAVLEFDENDNEYFLEYDTFEQYLEWCDIEKERVGKNAFCSQCEYFGHCLSEHLREVTSLEHSCNGFKHLIEWYKNGRMEN